MNTTKRTNPDFLNGVPELLLLKLLARQPMHGYDLVQAIKTQSDFTLEFGEGCIYPILHRLERERLLCSRRAAVGGRSRVVYHLTPAGARKLDESTTAWEQVVQAVGRVLKGGGHAEAAPA